MENNLQQDTPDQINPGQTDQSGNEVTVKRNEGISDQGNEWSDQEGVHEKGALLGEKAEKYIRDSADPEDMPEQEDTDAADATLKDAYIPGKATDDNVIESEDEFVPGYDLGRNKVQ